MADEEPLCVLPQLTKLCEPKCVAPFKQYNDCSKRLDAGKAGDCEPWYFDYLKCIDKCRVPQIMKHLK
ncbi:hypothetical protein B484DRAFT_352985 [Ochromonadaceae sp. CCMP2298]|nr:hypothetical protein B484DRAFT_352985 [Ochromonadaceae sp. CCMP2298]|eukprot:CAMPEP_0173240942 /NCGR_PEP_ID=MMETSP1142-20121109/14074_1 /TAXON_ID=483371 /ORGANISM="non described non described, Strain CCMP2298" /LENGTH=67 /DNA_ID=CAMNT_0014172175 /DNA_START=47 /DNA_END=250 /DNA_ORIENTATION=+